MKRFLSILFLLLLSLAPTIGSTVQSNPLEEVEIHTPSPTEGGAKAPSPKILTCFHNISTQELYLIGDYSDFTGTDIIITRCDNGRVVYTETNLSFSLFKTIQLADSDEYLISIILPSGITLWGIVNPS